MLALDPNERPSIEEILAHPWVTNTEVPEAADVLEEFKNRKEQVKQKIKGDRKEKEAEKADRVQKRQENMRSDADGD